MNNFEFPPNPTETKSPVAYSEMKVRAIINAIQIKLDKNHKDYGIIRTQLDRFTKRDYLVFATDYNLSSETKSLLTNPQSLINHGAVLTIKKKDDREKVIEIQVEK